jgi:histidine ammonia-lyase
MTVEIENRRDINLAAVERVAWQGESAALTARAVENMTWVRASFLRLIEQPDIVVYGVTSGYGQRASLRFDAEQRRKHAAQPTYGDAAAFGEPVPERLARAIVLARLTNFVAGNAAVTPALAQAVAAMLEADSLPEVPSLGNGGAGEILALSHLFQPVFANHELAEKDALALINGSPCAAALAADSAIEARRRLAVIEDIFALSFEALASPLEHVDPALDDFWDDEAESAALAALRQRLAGGNATRRPYQAPVSFRILPRMLGRLRRAIGGAERAANVSLAAVTDNPAYIPPEPGYPDGRVISNGGYHNTMAWPAMDELAAVCADLCTLCERHGAKLLDGKVSRLPDQLRDGPDDPRYLGALPMAQVGFGESARRAAQRTFLPGSESGGFGQNDVAAPHFFAWRAQAEAGARLEDCLAVLALIASQAFHITGATAPPALVARLERIRAVSSPLTGEMRPPGPDANALAEAFRGEITGPPA